MKEGKVSLTQHNLYIVTNFRWKQTMNKNGFKNNILEERGKRNQSI